MSQDQTVLIAGVTTRALAISAARSGYRVTAVDAFGDVDLRAVAEVITLGRNDGGYHPIRAAAAGAHVAAGMVAYTSNFENYPAAVADLASGRRLLGNRPEVLTRVRHPIELMRVLRRHGFRVPDTRAAAPRICRTRLQWLLKPRRSGGGHGIRVWQPGDAVSRSDYLQERIAGIPGSVIFAADGRSAAFLGFSRQLVAGARSGVGRFRYSGSLLGASGSRLFPRQSRLIATAMAIAGVVTREFELVGLNGVDFVARNGMPYPIEVNPRYSASMELVERAHGIPMFETHLRACQGSLPPPLSPAALVHGKAIVFARQDATLGDTGAWERSPSFADIPHSGEVIRRGHPICTVFARGTDARACQRLLRHQAAAVHRLVETCSRRAA
jgi:uncharacterized protein